MPLKAQDREFLKSMYQRLDDKPLEPGDPYYQPLYDPDGGSDPVSLMRTNIEWSPVESLQLFSGFRGSGKTTELFRLKDSLEKMDSLVLYSDADEYINPSEPIDIVDLLIVLAGAFSDGLEKHGIDLKSESYWTRLTHYLTKTTLDLTEISSKGGPAEFKLALKTTPSFRQRLQQTLAGRLGELKRQATEFVEYGVKQVQDKYGPDVRVVLLFDSLEKIRGSASNEQNVIRSVERLFADHIWLLSLNYVHVVYTVPPWLQFVMPGAVRIVMVPNIRVWNNDGERTRCEAGWSTLWSMIRRRFGAEGFERYFGPSPDGVNGLADRLIEVCGGHPRDLLYLLREALLRTNALPVPAETIEKAIAAVRSTFLPIAVEDAKWLDQIAKLRASALPSASPEDVGRLTRFLDSHLVLYLRNGEDWYDVHPLIRKEVADIVERDRRVSATATRGGTDGG